MYGAIIGDLAGSIYEYNQIIKVSQIKINNIIEDNSFYSDDTILTIAVLDAMINDKDFLKYLKRYGLKYIDYKPNYSPYFKTSFSPGFIKWLKGNHEGKSTGNGAMMRISPIGYLASTIEEVREYSKLATIPSHNSKEAIKCATMIAEIIFLSRHHYSKEDIIKHFNLKLKYTPFNTFNTTCYETINNCLYALFTSNSFEESIRTIISYGGDTDTNACIVGSMAEALYGVPDYLKEIVIKKLPTDFINIIDKYYKEEGHHKILKKRLLK